MSIKERLKYLEIAIRMAEIKVSIKDAEMILALDEYMFDKGGETTLDDIQQVVDVVNDRHDIQGA